MVYRIKYDPDYLHFDPREQIQIQTNRIKHDLMVGNDKIKHCNTSILNHKPKSWLNQGGWNDLLSSDWSIILQQAPSLTPNFKLLTVGATACSSLIPPIHLILEFSNFAILLHHSLYIYFGFRSHVSFPPDYRHSYS